MSPKPPGRPSAKDISDLDMLVAVDTYTRVGAPFPTDRFTEFPKNVVAAKLAKLTRRGLVDPRKRLTKDGRVVLDVLQEKADG